MKMKFTDMTITSLFLIFFMTISVPMFGKIYFVHHNASGTGDGSSWSNAINSLQAAIDLSIDGDTICVAAGTYYPTHKFNGDADQHLTFYINKNISLLGGFSGEPGSENDFASRNHLVHTTRLSGDVGVANDTLDNVFHVVYIDHVSDTMTLDGFTISDAFGLLGEGLFGTGGGMFLDGTAGRCNPVIKNCTIRDNNVKENGGGVTAYGSLGGILEPQFINCHFLNNKGSGGGGYFGYVDENGKETPVFISCSFKANLARTAQGSAIANVAHSSLSNQLLVNCIITGNHGPFTSAISLFTTGTGVVQSTILNSTITANSGGSIRISDIGAMASSLTIKNSILWNNPTLNGISIGGLTMDVTNCIVSGFVQGTDNLSNDPQFVDAPSAANAPHTEGDVHLLSTSPGIDAGSNAGVPLDITTDADGKARFVNPQTGLPGRVDIGAFELQELPVSITKVLRSDAIEVFPNPASDLIQVRVGQDITLGHMIISNDKGQVLYSADMKSLEKINSIPVHEYANGTYFISWSSEDAYDVEPVIIQR